MRKKKDVEKILHLKILNEYHVSMTVTIRLFSDYIAFSKPNTTPRISFVDFTPSLFISEWDLNNISPPFSFKFCLGPAEGVPLPFKQIRLMEF